MTQLVGRMTADGLVQRTTPEGDGRRGLDPADRAAIAAALPALERLLGSDPPSAGEQEQRENPSETEEGHP